MDRVERLKWLRDELVTSFEAADPANRAGLAKQLRDTLAEIDALGVSDEAGDQVDEFTARLEDRKREAASAGHPSAGRKPGAGSS